MSHVWSQQGEARRVCMHICSHIDNSYRITRPSLGGIAHSRSVLGTLTGWAGGHARAHGVSDAEHVERAVVGTGHGVSGGRQSASHRVHTAEPAVDPAGEVGRSRHVDAAENRPVTKREARDVA